MLGDGHVRFGGRAEETDQSKHRYRASARPYVLDGVARFSDGAGHAVFLRLDRLDEIEHGRLAYSPPD